MTLPGTWRFVIIPRRGSQLHPWHVPSFPVKKLGARQFGAGRRRARLARLSAMQIQPFRIEQYFGKYEFTAKYLLSSSDAESRTVQELLDLEPGSHERLLKHWCGYTESPGAPALREVISGMYRGVRPEDVLVMAATEEGIFVLYHALLSPGDHVIVETPCYESALEVARSTGARVSEWPRSEENGWAHDLAALEKLIQPNTKIIYVNTPHNPTGLVMPASVFEQVRSLAAGRRSAGSCSSSRIVFLPLAKSTNAPSAWVP